MSAGLPTLGGISITADPHVRTHVWRTFPDDLALKVRLACVAAWKQSLKWDDKDLQHNIEKEMKRGFGETLVRGNVRLVDLGVPRSYAQVDVVLDEPSGGLLLQVAGHTQPRLEKELLESISISLVNPQFTRAVLVVCHDKRLSLEKRTSFDYASGALMALAEPALIASKLSGLLIIGLPSLASSN